MSLILNPNRYFVAGGGGDMPSYVGISTVSMSGGTGSINFSSSGRLAGDLLIIGISTAGVSVTTPSGFSSQGFVGSGTAGGSNSAGMQVVTKISDGSETTVSIPDSGSWTIAWGLVIRGVDQTTPVHMATPSAEGVTTSHTASGPTTTIDNCLIVGLSSSGDNINFANLSNGNLSDLTERFEAATAVGHDGSIYGWTGGLASQGTVGDTSFTTSASERSATIVLAIAPE